MSEALRPGRPVPDEVRRVGVAIVDDAMEEFDRNPVEGSEEWHDVVHEVRKRMKELRALTRLVREANEEIHDVWNDAARDLARELSDVRDGHAMLETIDLLAEAFPDVAAEPLAHLRERRVEARDAMVADVPSHAELRDELVRIRAGVEAWELDDDGFDVLAGGIAKTYRRVQARHADAVEDPTTAVLHQLRKRVKYHRLHAELLAPAWETVLDAREDAWHDLTDQLGDDHDLAVLRSVLTDSDEDRAVAALVDRRRAELQRVAITGVGRACAEDADALVSRLRAAWEAAAEIDGIDPVEARALTLEPDPA